MRFFASLHSIVTLICHTLFLLTDREYGFAAVLRQQVGSGKFTATLSYTVFEVLNKNVAFKFSKTVIVLRGQICICISCSCAYAI